MLTFPTLTFSFSFMPLLYPSGIHVCIDFGHLYYPLHLRPKREGKHSIF